MNDETINDKILAELRTKEFGILRIRDRVGYEIAQKMLDHISAKLKKKKSLLGEPNK